MKLGVNLDLWADDMHDGLLPVLERLKQVGYDGWLTVEASGNFLPNLAADAYAFLASRFVRGAHA